MNKLFYILLLFLVFFTYFFVYQYVSLESPIYADFRFYSYHQEYINSIELIKNYGFEGILDLFERTKNITTSIFSVVLLSFFGIFFKYSRTDYILIISYLYLLPSILFTFWLYKKTFAEYLEKSYFLQIILFSILYLNIYYWLPTLRGMPDVSAIIPFTIAIYMIYKNNLRDNILFKKSLFVGILIFVSFLLRRTFSTAIFILFITTIIYNFIFIIKDLFNKKNVFIQIFNLFVNLLIPTLIFIGLFKFCLPTLFDYFIDGSLMEECSYYLSNSNLLKSILDIIKYINPITLLLLIVPLLFIKKTKYNPFLNFAYIFISLYILLFIFIQDILPENVLPISVFINIVCVYSISLIYNNLVNNYFKYFVAIIFLLFYSFNFYSFFFKDFNNKNIIEKCLLSSHRESGTPLINKNYPQFKQVYDFLEEKIKENPNYTISSITSDRLFDHATIVYYSLVNNKKEMIENIISTPAPNTYGLVFDTYESDFLIVEKNWTKYIEEDDWLPISIPHELFEDNKGISEYYTKIFKIKTNNDSSGYVYIFKKNKNIPIEEMEFILNEFIEKEPDKKELVVSQFEKYKNIKDYKIIFYNFYKYLEKNKNKNSVYLLNVWLKEKLISLSSDRISNILKENLYFTKNKIIPKNKDGRKLLDDLYEFSVFIESKKLRNLLDKYKYY